MIEKKKDGKCARSVNRGDSRWAIFQPCGRDAVTADRKGEPVCGIHRAADVREEKKRRRWAEDYARGKALEAKAAELSRAIGVSVRAHYDAVLRRPPGYTGDMVVPLAWLEAVAARAASGAPVGGEG